MRGDAPALAEFLRRDFNAELILMVANDRRADKGVFEVHYLFAQDREDWFLHMRQMSRPNAWRSPRWPRSTIRLHALSARFMICSASKPFAILISDRS